MSIFVVITKENDVEPLVEWGIRLATIREKPLHIAIPSGRHHEELHTKLSLDEEQEDPILEAVRNRIVSMETPPVVYHVHGKPVLDNLLLTSKEAQTSLMLVGFASKKEVQKFPLSGIYQLLLKEALCDLIVLRGEAGSGVDCNKILIPTNGNSRGDLEVLKLGAQIAKDGDIEVEALYVEQESGQEAHELGMHILDKIRNKAGVKDDPSMTSQVVLADDVYKGIAQRAEDGFDLILVGAAKDHLMQGRLLRTLPERLLKGYYKTALGIFRPAPPLGERTRNYFAQQIGRVIPQLEREDRLQLFERLQNGSRLNMDFVMLIALSTAIASFGLLQNSTAVVIGAMLVAPLMTPLLGAGMGLVQGNIVLVKDAIRSVILGIALSLLVSGAIGFFTPHAHTLTSEMLARGQPNLLDLIVAIFSGVAAAYALARPGMLEALPGVAIAAALIPPLATVGLSLTLQHTKNATGAAFLFGTNLVAIILASAFTMYLLGVRANRTQGQSRIWARRALVTLFLTSLIIAVPLGSALLSSITKEENTLRRNIQAQLKKLTKKAVTHASLASIERSHLGERVTLTVKIYYHKHLPEKMAKTLLKHIRKQVPKQVSIRLVTLLVWQDHSTSSVK